MKQYLYPDYKAYVAAQVEANKRKLSNVWVRPETVAQVVRNAPVKVDAVMCHGTRNGAEQRLFAEHYPGAFVIGTEISDTATQFPNTVQHDFHEPKEEWIKRFDIVYSNSFDHAFDPLRALLAWRGQLAPGGRLFLEHGISEVVNCSTASDPLELDAEDILRLLDEAGFDLVRTFCANGIKGGEEHASIVYVAEAR